MVEVVTPMFFQSEDGVLVRVIDGPNNATLYQRYDAQDGVFMEDFEYVYAVIQGRDPEDTFEYQEHELLRKGEFNKRLFNEQVNRAKRIGFPLPLKLEPVVTRKAIEDKTPVDPEEFKDSAGVEKPPGDLDKYDREILDKAEESTENKTDEQIFEGLAPHLQP